MKQSLIRPLALLTCVGLLAWGGWAFAAAHGSDHGHHGKHHEHAEHMHAKHMHDAHMHHAIHELIAALELDDVQNAHLEALHEAMMAVHGGGGPAEHLHTLVEHVHRGQLNAGAVRQLVDQHVEEMRVAGYRLGDALVALLDSFDADQQDLLDRHLEHARQQMDAHRKMHEQRAEGDDHQDDDRR